MYEHYHFENIFEIMILKTNSLLIEFEFYAKQVRSNINGVQILYDLLISEFFIKYLNLDNTCLVYLNSSIRNWLFRIKFLSILNQDISLSL